MTKFNYDPVAPFSVIAIDAGGVLHASTWAHLDEALVEVMTVGDDRQRRHEQVIDAEGHTVYLYNDHDGLVTIGACYPAFEQIARNSSASAEECVMLRIASQEIMSSLGASR